MKMINQVRLFLVSLVICLTFFPVAVHALQGVKEKHPMGEDSTRKPALCFQTDTLPLERVILLVEKLSPLFDHSPCLRDQARLVNIEIDNRPALTRIAYNLDRRNWEANGTTWSEALDELYSQVDHGLGHLSLSPRFVGKKLRVLKPQPGGDKGKALTIGSGSHDKQFIMQPPPGILEIRKVQGSLKEIEHYVTRRGVAFFCQRSEDCQTGPSKGKCETLEERLVFASCVSTRGHGLARQHSILADGCEFHHYKDDVVCELKRTDCDHVDLFRSDEFCVDYSTCRKIPGT